MDRFIQAFRPAVEDDDLVLCPAHGVAFQKDRSHLVAYDATYFDKCAGYDGQQIANKINAGRRDLVDRYCGTTPVCDVGIGSGEFIRTRPNTFGQDVNPVAIEWLKRNEKWAARIDRFFGVTFWDVLEHCEDPGVYLDQVPAYLFASVPIFSDLDTIRTSKHYRPGEHLFYWTEDGFVEWLRLYGFAVRTVEQFEIEAGRDSIYSFVFERVRWVPN